MHSAHTREVRFHTHTNPHLTVRSSPAHYQDPSYDWLVSRSLTEPLYHTLPIITYPTGSPVMPAFFAYAVIFAALVTSTRAALYPNHPVANTVFEAGKEATVTWIDDGSNPHLNELPKLQLDLYGPDDVGLLTPAMHAPSDCIRFRNCCIRSTKTWTLIASGATSCSRLSPSVVARTARDSA